MTQFPGYVFNYNYLHLLELCSDVWRGGSTIGSGCSAPGCDAVKTACSVRCRVTAHRNRWFIFCAQKLKLIGDTQTKYRGCKAEIIAMDIKMQGARNPAVSYEFTHREKLYSKSVTHTHLHHVSSRWRVPSVTATSIVTVHKRFQTQ